jgi:acyl transferase domain-containing protein/NAD(P)H-dependent flavin oxidoreductase YrpB (nitropropane dioxygenase family)/NAD(P)-dependent dehydrogenase (short-subunit alcohol dehydrogenase family)
MEPSTNQLTGPGRPRTRAEARARPRARQTSRSVGGSPFEQQAQRFRLLAITPCERADLGLAKALRKLTVATALDLGRDPAGWPALFTSIQREHSIGIRIGDHVEVPTDLALPANVEFIIVDGDGSALPTSWRKASWIAQVVSIVEAQRAIAFGASGLIAKGQESGGRVGDESSFVLLQRLVELTAGRVPVWCQGGIGLHTAAGAFAGGAFGVVLDAQLGAYPESSLDDAIKQQVLAMDGSEARVGSGYQVYARTPAEIAALDALSADAVRSALQARTLLPLGQDAALCKLLMAECANLEALVQTLRLRVDGQLHQARELRPLDENAAWARSHGTRYPIAQGPMTRVSDTAEFAVAVAENGGLPFLALSLMNASASRTLLEATRDQIGDKPWGVGVLGFAAPEILDPQLALIREIKPSVLLLAGGRPSQARPFIEAGIPTYLHVPSPGLLDLFLKDGATHFVFEGRECGGHVGPRYSFVLWEQALARLAQVEHAEELHVLFAGGIHDERSSAMVAALAAPLAARGAKIGVLMGTAYIATTEAVEAGAVLEDFQRQSLQGDSTVLVETAPGHAIRCLQSGFVDLFERRKRELQSASVETKEAWKELESLTVGRLRIATKGLDYVNDKLSAVDQQRQRAEGMYMIGQIIALRHEVISIAALHERVARGASAYLQALEPPTLRLPAREAPIAIVGMACLYPGSPDLEAYWSHILEGRDLVREVPAERWSVERYYRGADAGPDQSVSKWGGFLDDTPFDPLQYGIPPQSLAAIEPVQLLSLEVANQALRDAGYTPSAGGRWFDRERTSVIFGAEGGMDLAAQYNFRNLYQQYCGDLPTELAQALPTLTEDSFPGVLVNVISGRIANRLGLGGVNYSVDSACASSLTAIELAVKELRSSSSEMVLAGGADFHNGITDFLMFSSVGALSASGRCKSFDDNADGIALGEGVGIVVLKRLEDAQADGDRIYAVIDGIAGSSDGKALGLTAPRKEGQKRALDRCYWQAGVLPSEIGLVEAHGTGTVVGDRTELRTLTEVFGAYGALPQQAALGSVKSQIGHTKCAAGIAGLIKVAKALHHGVLPPTGLITQPNAWHRAATSPFALNRTPQPWLAQSTAKRAAVSAFGFGGTNFHAVLSGYPAHQNRQGALHWPAELFAFRGDSAAAIAPRLRELADYLTASDAPLSLRDLAATVWAHGAGTVQLAFVASTRAELAAKLANALQQNNASGLHRRDDARSAERIAFLFSGQGSQYPGMLRELFVYFPALRELLALAPDLLPLIYPSTAYDDATRSAQQQRLTDTRVTQPALGLVELAGFEWLQSLGLKADMAAGHSYGELAALAAAGAFDAQTLVRLSRLRAEAILASVGEDSGAMAAVRLDVDSLRPLLAGFPSVVMANQNSPVQTVISGPTADVHAACELLKQHAVGYKLIDTDCAFHSPLMAAAERRYASTLASEEVHPLRWPVYSNITAEPHPDDAVAIRDSLARHIVSPVRFVSEVERLYADGARVFVEIGPKRVLTGLVNRILKDQTHTALALDPEERGLAGLLEVVAQLAVRSSRFDASALFAERARTLDLTQPRKLGATTWLVNGGRAWPLRGKAPAHAAAVVLEPVVSANSVAAIAAPAQATLAAGDQAIVSYLHNMRDLVNAQRDVLLGYFGAPAAAPYVRTIHPSPAGRGTEGEGASGSSKARYHGESLTPAALPAGEGYKNAQTLSAPLQAETSVANARGVLLSIVSERTGYPSEMLDLDLDLEADLSIDSIKRLEVIGDLAQKLSLREAFGANADVLIEQLAAKKTLRAVLDFLSEKLPKTVASAAASAAHAPAAVAAQRPVAELLLDIVSQSTGYPAEALDLDLDLEADLSIDSIKRLEIVGQLASGLGLDASQGKDALLERLSAQKTLRAVIELLNQAAPTTQATPTSATKPTVQLTADSEAGIPLERYLLRPLPAPPARAGNIDLANKQFLITDDKLGIAPQLAARLQARGAKTRIVEFSASHAESGLAEVDGLIHLWSLNPDSLVIEVKHFFALAREALLSKARHLLVASALGGDFGQGGTGGSHFNRGGGFAGMIKTVEKEFPELRAHWVDLHADEPQQALLDALETELLAGNPLAEVAYLNGQRYAREVVPVALSEGSLDGLPLTPESVVLLTGGARGITALIAVALARRYRCRLELVGRSEAPEGPEDALTRGVTDPRRLRQLLLQADPTRKPAEIERLARRILAEREVRETFAQVREAGSTVHYTPLDVRDEDAFASFIAETYSRHGRIDGVIHGAGVVEDKLVRDKTDESFGRVFDTKVRSALILNRLIRDDVKFVVFFSSVASAFGNRGQVDYASANDVLDKLAHHWQTRIGGRVISVNWGPWADTGMVNDALRNDYARKGIGLIPQVAGVEALLRELSISRGDSQIVLMCGKPESFGAAAPLA